MSIIHRPYFTKLGFCSVICRVWYVRFHANRSAFRTDISPLSVLNVGKSITAEPSLTKSCDKCSSSDFFPVFFHFITSLSCGCFWISFLSLLFILLPVPTWIPNLRFLSSSIIQSIHRPKSACLSAGKISFNIVGFFERRMVRSIFSKIASSP